MGFASVEGWMDGRPRIPPGQTTRQERRHEMTPEGRPATVRAGILGAPLRSTQRDDMRWQRSAHKRLYGQGSLRRWETTWDDGGGCYYTGRDPWGAVAARRQRAMTPPTRQQTVIHSRGEDSHPGQRADEIADTTPEMTADTTADTSGSVTKWCVTVRKGLGADQKR